MCVGIGSSYTPLVSKFLRGHPLIHYGNIKNIDGAYLTGEFMCEVNGVKQRDSYPMRVLRMKDLVAMLGISRSSIYEKLNPKSKYYDIDFPKPIKLGAASVGWLSTAIEIWIAMRSSDDGRMGREC